VNNRLGHADIRKIKLHAWIKDMPWGKIRRKIFKSPCITRVYRRPKYGVAKEKFKPVS